MYINKYSFQLLASFFFNGAIDLRHGAAQAEAAPGTADLCLAAAAAAAEFQVLAARLQAVQGGSRCPPRWERNKKKING